MKRSLFPENVEVHQADLERTESTKAEEVKARTADGSRINRDGDIITPGGIVDGLRVTVSASPNATRVDISPGSAYTPSGERIVVATTQPTVALSDPTDATINIVCLVYTETLGTPRPHETAGTTHNSAADASFRVAVYTQAEYDALPETNEDLDEDAKDRVVMLARVLGNGAGVDLLSGEVFQTALPSTYCGVRFTSSALLGVNLISSTSPTLPSPFTATQSGRIELVVTDAVTKTLKFHEPGHTTYGAAVNVAALDGTTTLSSALSPVTTLTVEVASKALPHAAGTYTQNITFERVHDVGPIQIPGAEGTNYSPADHAHRENLGSGSRSIDNPHGTHINDIAQGVLRYLRTLDIGRGLIGSQSTAEVPRIVTPTATLISVDKTLLWEIPGSFGVIRVYQDRVTAGLEFTLNAQWSNVSSTYAADDIGSTAYRLIINSATTEREFDFGIVTGSASFTDFASVFRSGRLNSTHPNLLDIGRGFLGSEAAMLVPRIRLDGGSASFERTRLFTSRATDATTDNRYTLNVYRVSGASSTLPGENALEISCNANWDGTNWVQYTNGVGSWKLELSISTFKLHYFSGSGSFADSAWSAVPVALTTSGSLVLTGDLTVGDDLTVTDNAAVDSLTVVGSATVGNDLAVVDDISAGGTTSSVDFAFNPAKTFYVSIPPSAGAGYKASSGSFVYVSGPSYPTGTADAPATSAPYYYTAGAGAGSFAGVEFPLYVPNGATLTGLRAWAGVVPNIGNPVMRLIRVPMTTIGVPTYSAVVLNYSLSSTGAFTTPDQFEVAAFSHTVNNATYAYYISFADVGASPNAVIAVYSIRVTYTMTTVAF